MLNRLNNINGKGSNAVINKQIKDLQEDVSQLKSDVAQDQLDIAALDAELDNKVSKSELASEVDTASLKANTAKIDTIESKDANDVTVNDNLNVNGDVTATGKVSATSFEANGVDIVDDYTQKTSCALSDAANAVCTANDALDCACAVNCRLNDYKQAISEKVTSTCGEIGDLSVSNAIDTKSLTVTEKASIKEVEAEITNTTYNTFNSKIEPTVKASGSWYHFNLPSKFQGRAHVIGVDADDNQLFSAIIDTAFSDRAGSPAGDREGTGMIIHSGVNKYDFYILTRRKDIDQIGFITQADITKLYFKYDNFDKTEAPTYDIYADLTPVNFDPNTYDTIYTAEHSDQVVIFGSDKTLNGGITILGTFNATAVDIPQSVITDAYIKENIYGGYDCDTGEFTTQGTQGGVLTYNQRSGSGECNVSWIQGCPRQYVRKGVCLCTDGQGRKCSDLEFEDVVTKDPLTGTYNPDDNSDKLFDEAGLAAYNGVTCTGNYPINHLGDNTCVHGRMQTAGDIRAEGQIVSEGDVVVHGDLFVDGTSHVVDVEEIQSSGDYEILRSGQPSGITSYAGTIIENYDGTDKHVFIGADCCGEVRIGKNAQTAVSTYTDISDYNSQYYDGLTQTATTGPSGYMTNIDAVELNNVVYNSTVGTEIVAGYYHWEGVHYFGPLTIVSGKFDLGSIITDATDIATLDALTRRGLVYYNSVTDNVLADIDINQPVLTRNESGNLSDKALLQWDATYRRADAINMPTANNTALVACVVNGCVDHYEWKLIPDFDHIYPIGSVYQNLTCATNPGTLLGQGTWVQITDRFIVARGTTYTACGGSATATLAVCHLPSHCHAITDHKHSGSVGSHCHTGPSHCHATPNHCHSLSGTFCTNCAGNHYHDVCFGTNTSGNDGKLRACTGGNFDYGCNAITANSGCHCHTVTLSGNTGNAAPTTCAAGTGNTGNATPSFTGGSMCAAVNTGNTGNGCSFSIIPPYCAVYTWYRCA